MCHPVRQHFLLLRGLGRLSLVVFWRTDESVCPYFVASPLDGKNHSNRLQLGAPPLGGGWEGVPSKGVCPYFEDSPSDNGGISSLSREAFFETKKRPRCIKRTPASKRRGRSFVFSSAVPANEALPHYTPTIHHFISKQLCLRPSPFGEGTGERLYLTGSR